MLKSKKKNDFIKSAQIIKKEYLELVPNFYNQNCERKLWDLYKFSTVLWQLKKRVHLIMKIIWTEKALTSFEEIINYLINKFGSNTALNFYEETMSIIESIDKNNDIGKRIVLTIVFIVNLLLLKKLQ